MKTKIDIHIQQWKQLFAFPHLSHSLLNSLTIGSIACRSIAPANQFSVCNCVDFAFWINCKIFGYNSASLSNLPDPSQNTYARPLQRRSTFCPTPAERKPGLPSSPCFQGCQGYPLLLLLRIRLSFPLLSHRPLLRKPLLWNKCLRVNEKREQQKLSMTFYAIFHSTRDAHFRWFLSAMEHL